MAHRSDAIRRASRSKRPRRLNLRLPHPTSIGPTASPTSNIDRSVESAGRFYLLSADTLPATLKRLDDPADNLAGLLSADDLVLEWPLGQGWRFCDPKGIVRTDQLYCWFVESIAPTTQYKIPGTKDVPRDEYQLSYKTNPDQVNVSFVPDIGITHYEYHHHGAIADTTLIALRIPSRRNKEVASFPETSPRASVNSASLRSIFSFTSPCGDLARPSVHGYHAERFIFSLHAWRQQCFPADCLPNRRTSSKHPSASPQLRRH